jgi:hypothetical protein
MATGLLFAHDECTDCTPHSPLVSSSGNSAAKQLRSLEVTQGMSQKAQACGSSP